MTFCLYLIAHGACRGKVVIITERAAESACASSILCGITPIVSPKQVPHVLASQVIIKDDVHEGWDVEGK